MQAPRWRRPIRCLRPRALAGRLTRAIDVEDEEVVPLSIPQAARLLLFHQGTRQQIVQKEGEPRLTRSLIKRGEKAAERRTRRPPVAPEERHERACPGLEPLVKGFQRPLGACRIAEKHGGKIDHLVPSEAATSKAHLLFNGSKQVLAF